MHLNEEPVLLVSRSFTQAHDLQNSPDDKPERLCGVKIDKKQKQEIKEVLKKYNRTQTDVAKSYLRKATLGTVLGVGLDLFTTGGIGTVTVIAAAMLPGFKGVARIAASLGLTQEDARPQKIRAKPDVLKALGDIQLKLSYSFQKARDVVPNATATELEVSQRDKKEFFRLADEAEQDIRKLSPAFKIVSEGEGYGRKKFQPLVATNPGVSLWKTGLYTLDEARAIVRAKMEEEASPQAKLAAAQPRKPTRFNV